MDFKSFISHVQNNLLKEDEPQEKCGKGKYRWTADMWTLGVAECLNSGVTKYEPKKRIYQLYKKDLTIASNFKLRTLEMLEKIKDKANCLFVGEVGRGLDILIAESIKKWDLIYCYDQVNYDKHLCDLFGDRIKFTKTITKNFNLSNIEECIMILNTNTTLDIESLVKNMGEQINRYIRCDKIKNIILNGEIIK